MARQTYYVARDTKHPLYKTRMLTAGQGIELDAGTARLYRQLGVEITDEKPRKAAKVEAPKVEEAEVVEAPKAETPVAEATPKAGAKARAKKKAPAKK